MKATIDIASLLASDVCPENNEKLPHKEPSGQSKFIKKDIGTNGASVTNSVKTPRNSV